MENWEYKMAGEFKKRDNKNLLSPCIGTVISTTPFKVSIQNGLYLLDKDNAYVCRHILERKSKMSFKANNTQSSSGNINISCEGAGGFSLTSNGSMTVEKQDVHLFEMWETGDSVLVIPDGKNEKFFIVDVLEGV